MIHRKGISGFKEISPARQFAKNSHENSRFEQYSCALFIHCLGVSLKEIKSKHLTKIRQYYKTDLRFSLLSIMRFYNSFLSV